MESKKRNVPLRLKGCAFIGAGIVKRICNVQRGRVLQQCQFGLTVIRLSDKMHKQIYLKIIALVKTWL